MTEAERSILVWISGNVFILNSSDVIGIFFMKTFIRATGIKSISNNRGDQELLSYMAKD